jgi:hypothetical protein
MFKKKMVRLDEKQQIKSKNISSKIAKIKIERATTISCL